jgi:hypothetical protein
VSPDHSHCATTLVGVPADRAYAFLVDPVALGRWSLGCMDLTHVGNGVYRGRSLFDGGEGWLSIDGDPQRRVVDYHVGTLDQRLPRISARVVPGPVCGLAPAECYVSLLAWRARSMDEARWQRLFASHAAEICLIKAQLEAASRGEP